MIVEFSVLLGSLILSNHQNLKLLNMHNIFSHASPEFWIMKSKSKEISLILDSNYLPVDYK